MKVFIECYGASARWCGAERIVLELPEGASAGEVLRRLETRFPELQSRQGAIAMARDADIIRPDTPLSPGDELALIPPVSGG